MFLVDSHIHLDFPAFDKDRKKLITDAAAKGIKRFIVPATTQKSWESISALTQTYPSISPAYGIHPYFINDHSLKDCDGLDAWVAKNPCVAIGEIGLDHYLSNLDHTKQLALFKAQLTVANKHQLPVILHARKAVELVTNTLKGYGLRQGILHSFNGSFVQAMRLIELGFKLGFGGAITYPRATRLRSLIKQLPLEAICLETDAPDQPALIYSDQRNEPDALLTVLNTVCELRDAPPELIREQTTRNTLSALNIC